MNASDPLCLCLWLALFPSVPLPPLVSTARCGAFKLPNLEEILVRILHSTGPTSFFAVAVQVAENERSGPTNKPAGWLAFVLFPTLPFQEPWQYVFSVPARNLT